MSGDGRGDGDSVGALTSSNENEDPEGSHTCIDSTNDDVVLLPLSESNHQAEYDAGTSYMDKWRLLQTSLDRKAVENDDAIRRPPLPTYILALPKADDADAVNVNDLEHLLDSYEDVPLFEEMAKQWRTTLSDAINETKNKERAKGPSPLEEIDFWHQRANDLRALAKQIQSKPIRNVITALTHHSSSVVSTVNRGMLDVLHMSSEATSNVKYLSKLQRHLIILRDWSLSDIAATLPSLVESISIISRCHYNRGERLAPLIEKISWQLLHRVKDEIKIGSILKQIANRHCFGEATSEISHAKRILEFWREQRTESNADKRVFGGTYHATSVVGALHENFVCIDHFLSFTESDLVKKICGDGVLQAENHIRDLSTYIEGVANKFDIFDSANARAWEEAMEKFNQQVESIDTLCIKAVSCAMQDLSDCSSLTALHIFESFLNNDTKSHRPAIHSYVSQHYRQSILGQYEKELSTLEACFDSEKNAPPIGMSHYATSGAIKWAHTLYQKAKCPILQFNRPDGILQTRPSEEILEKYLNFAKQIDAYKDDLLKDWKENALIIAREGLRRPVLGRDFGSEDRDKCEMIASPPLSTVETEAMPHNDFGRAVHVPLRCNFCQQLLAIIKEAKQLELMDVSLPLDLKAVVLNERSYYELIMSVEKTVIAPYNDALSSLNAVQAAMLKHQIQTLDNSLNPGLVILNWNSFRIQKFVHQNAKSAIQRFEEIVLFVAIDDIIENREYFPRERRTRDGCTH